jgi:hypothetical protein
MYSTSTVHKIVHTRNSGFVKAVSLAGLFLSTPTFSCQALARCFVEPAATFESLYSDHLPRHACVAVFVRRPVQRSCEFALGMTAGAAAL